MLCLVEQVHKTQYFVNIVPRPCFSACKNHTRQILFSRKEICESPPWLLHISHQERETKALTSLHASSFLPRKGIQTLIATKRQLYSDFPTSFLYQLFYAYCRSTIVKWYLRRLSSNEIFDSPDCWTKHVLRDDVNANGEVTKLQTDGRDFDKPEKRSNEVHIPS
jgi:hypothetical protein